jgi:hypothetical protein
VSAHIFSIVPIRAEGKGLRARAEEYRRDGQLWNLKPSALSP